MGFTSTKPGQSELWTLKQTPTKPKQNKETKPGTESVLGAAQYTAMELDRNMNYFENFQQG